MLICEAEPRRGVHRRPTRSAIGPPGGDEELPAGAGPRESFRLPRVLVGLRVLVVDDDEDAAELFAAALAACGADVVVVHTARDALGSFVAQAPSVVVTDIAMPGADGYWLMREIRQLEEASRGIPVLAVTAFSQEHFRARVLAAGFIEHLVKPVDPEALCLAVARAGGR